jgi:serine/threonine protein kinase
MLEKIDINYQHKKGEILRGELARYEIIIPMGHGAFSETYKAKIIKIETVLEEMEIGQEVVIKIPKLDINRPLQEKVKYLTSILEQLIHEYTSLKRLRGIGGIAQVLDYGTYQYILDHERDISAPTVFLVKELIDGKRLDDFFILAKKLSSNLRQIHQNQVVHGDLWPQNIMINSDNEPIIIDFGQALFRDLVFLPAERATASHAYIPPEGSGFVGADIFSLGCVFYYLATGEDPPMPVEDIDKLKIQITEKIRKINETLYNKNCGIVDIIARCLRYSQHDRNPHVENVLQDLETFDIDNLLNNNVVRVEEEILQELDSQHIPLFSWMSRLLIRKLECDIEDMMHGVYDLIGNHDDIVSALTQYLSSLQKDDQYLTISTPSFWHTQNIGINGRFLAMTKLVALRGATIRRIFLITPEDVAKDHELKKIIDSHIRVIKELALMGIQTNASEIKAGGYYTSYKIIEQKEIERLVQEGRHFGLLVKEGQEILIIPIYREDGTMVAVQFRANSDITANLREYFSILLNESIPLINYHKQGQKRK